MYRCRVYFIRVVGLALPDKVWLRLIYGKLFTCKLVYMVIYHISLLT